jgi:hypothetical protein
LNPIPPPNTPVDLVEAVADLWRMPPPGPSNLFATNQFKHLRNICSTLFGSTQSKDALSFALSYALRAYGMPCGLSPENAHLALAPDIAAAKLNIAFNAKHSTRTHLCPLDLADDLPTIRFGSCSIGKLSATELRNIVNSTRLARTNPKWEFDADRFSQFSWLIVTEEIKLNREPGARAFPFLFEIWGEMGTTNPHPERFPKAVEDALSAILLAPWEDWVESPELDWRAFHVPWVYTVDEDVFVRPAAPPSADSLSWEPHIFTDPYGEEFEEERPTALPLSERTSRATEYLNDSFWVILEKARTTPLFETPILHFLIRAFATEGIDSFLAHVTLIEAALGLQSDHERSRRPKVSNHGDPGATIRVALRVAGLLGDIGEGDAFKLIFKARSEYLHGRAMNPLSHKERLLARRLARRIVRALADVCLTLPESATRKAYLEALTEDGARVHLAQQASPK